MKKKRLRFAWRAWLVISVLLFLALAVAWPMSTDRHIAIGRWIKLNDVQQQSSGWLVTFHDGWFLWQRTRERMIDRSPVWIPMPSGGIGWMPPYDTLDQHRMAQPTHTVESGWTWLEDKPGTSYAFVGVPDDISAWNAFIWDTTHTHSGFEGGMSLRISLQTYKTRVLPVWFMMLLLSLSPILAFWRWRRRRGWRGHDGKAQPCSKCGYDLRGSEEGTACPECGKMNPATAG